MISSRSSFSLLTTSFTFSPRVLGEKVLLVSFLVVPLVLRLVLLPISASITCRTQSHTTHTLFTRN
jgi:hypothetical protein